MPKAPGPALGLRERKKLRTRKQLVEASLRLFAERGYDQVTIEQIAAEVEVSPSTFVRYFEHKEDVLFDDDGERISHLQSAMADRPPDEPVLTAVRHALLTLVRDIEDDRETMLVKARITLETPSLRARGLEDQARLEEALAAAVAQRLGGDESDHMRPRIVAAAAIAAVRVAVEIWLAEDDARPLEEYLGDALALLDGSLDEALTR